MKLAIKKVRCDNSSPWLQSTDCYRGKLGKSSKAAELETKETPYYLAVTYARVDSKHRGQGLGTKMWEHAARDACKRLNKPLASDTKRSTMAEAFWQKQMAKGRARKVKAAGGNRYVLSCPAPRSLAGLEGKRR